ncbi:DegV family protein [Clostridium fungisolvens]|uniref:DegV domain-containing protein n=1 Tax=Clostridium fungisolvens TaxID=1604897 RepID=A0A6V8SHJ1_9CLOT|nr:DegV family protein [Clostridium fungisolvens]GFP76062.1 DegV domain-containing protein [Clostridium fungisolvens]
MIKIMVDSTCDLPRDIIEKYEIKVLPLRVSLEGVEYLDKKTIQVDEVYSFIRRGIVPKTSQVNPKDFYDAFEEYCNKGQDFIYLSFSSKLSGTYGLARNILDEIKEKYPNNKMEVLDSKGGSTATGLIALQAVKLIEKGLKFEVVLNQLNQLVEHVEHIFSISDLRWLVKGGRVGMVSGTIGSMMDIRPILDVEDGRMKVIRNVRGKKKALNTIVDIVEQRFKNFPNQMIGISHADELETAEELIKLIKDRLGIRDIMINKIGSVLGSHLGIGGVGVFFFNKEPDIYI